MADSLSRIEAQRAYFASADRVRERAAVWADATPEECLEAVREECRAAMQLLALKSPDEQEAAMRPDPIPPHTVMILERIQRFSR